MKISTIVLSALFATASAITDPQWTEAAKIHQDIQSALSTHVHGGNAQKVDVVDFARATVAQRQALCKSFHSWLIQSAQVQQGYAHAAAFEAQNVEYTPFSIGQNGIPVNASLNFSNQHAVLDQWRSAVQADQNLGQNIQSGFLQFIGQVHQQLQTFEFKFKRDHLAAQQADKDAWSKVKNDTIQAYTPVTSMIQDLLASKAEKLNQDIQAASAPDAEHHHHHHHHDNSTHEHHHHDHLNGTGEHHHHHHHGNATCEHHHHHDHKCTCEHHDHHHNCTCGIVCTDDTDCAHCNGCTDSNACTDSDDCTNCTNVAKLTKHVSIPEAHNKLALAQVIQNVTPTQAADVASTHLKNIGNSLFAYVKGSTRNYIRSQNHSSHLSSNSSALSSNTSASVAENCDCDDNCACKHHNHDNGNEHHHHHHHHHNGTCEHHHHHHDHKCTCEHHDHHHNCTCEIVCTNDTDCAHCNGCTDSDACTDSDDCTNCTTVAKLGKSVSIHEAHNKLALAKVIQNVTLNQAADVGSAHLKNVGNSLISAVKVSVNDNSVYYCIGAIIMTLSAAVIVSKKAKKQKKMIELVDMENLVSQKKAERDAFIVEANLTDLLPDLGQWHQSLAQ